MRAREVVHRGLQAAEAPFERDRSRPLQDARSRQRVAGVEHRFGLAPAEVGRVVAHREGFEPVGGQGRGLGRGLVREPGPLRVDAERERLDDPGRAMEFGDGRVPARENRAPAPCASSS